MSNEHCPRIHLMNDFGIGTEWNTFAACEIRIDSRCCIVIVESETDPDSLESSAHIRVDGSIHCVSYLN